MLSVIGIILVSRMSQEALDAIGKEAISLLKEWHLLGWIFSILLTLILIFVNRFKTRTHRKEIERLSEEKEWLQETLRGLTKD